MFTGGKICISAACEASFARAGMFKKTLFSMKWYFVYLFLIFFYLPVQAQRSTAGRATNLRKDFALVTYTINDGLPSRNTTTAIKDKYGFMWVGTQNGLCKFDGYNLKHFRITSLIVILYPIIL